MTSITLYRGLPGSGKSTAAKTAARQDDSVIHLEADMYFIDDGNYALDPNKLGAAHGWCLDRAEDYLRAGRDVVVTNTFTTLKEMRPYFESALKYGLIPRVVLFQNQFDNVHDVPVEAMERMENRFVFNIKPLMNEFKQKLEVIMLND
jgi:predicted kinase